jgi:PhnB protein
MLMRFKDSPERHAPGMLSPGAENKVMHMSFRIGETTLLASDGRRQGRQAYEGFALSHIVSTEAEVEQRFAILAEGGQVQMPLTKTFFSARFDMVADRFGASWMVWVAPRVPHPLAHEQPALRFPARLHRGAEAFLGVGAIAGG